jgi:transcriptional regulator with XRE-family HTH domain
MPPRIRNTKRPRRKIYIREWRKYRDDMSQERLVARLLEMGVEMSIAQLSRIETGVQPYTQDTLEAIADALRTDPASLLWRNPEDDDAIWTIWEHAKPAERQQITKVLRALKTGS